MATLKFHQVFARVAPIERRIRDYIVNFLSDSEMAKDWNFDVVQGRVLALKIKRNLPLSHSEAELLEKALIDNWEFFEDDNFFNEIGLYRLDGTAVNG